jgi:hypothetical protein
LHAKARSGSATCDTRRIGWPSSFKISERVRRDLAPSWQRFHGSWGEQSAPVEFEAIDDGMGFDQLLGWSSEVEGIAAQANASGHARERSSGTARRSRLVVSDIGGVSDIFYCVPFYP